MIEYYITSESVYFILEFIEGGSLHELMKKFGVFPEPLLIIYISQVIKALQYLHSQEIIHRDIKGANLLLTKDGIVKLVDFGSCALVAVGAEQIVAGTPFWMSPEAISNTVATTLSDIWSLGCTILELFTGAPPYWKLGATVALYRMGEDAHPPLPTNLSENLADFLRKCFIKDWKQRINADELIKHQWIAEIKVSSSIDYNTAKHTIREYNKKPERLSLADIDWKGESNSKVSSPRSPKSPRFINTNEEEFPRKSLQDIKVMHDTKRPPSERVEKKKKDNSKVNELEIRVKQADNEKQKILKTVEDLTARLATVLEEKKILENQFKNLQAQLFINQQAIAQKIRQFADEIAVTSSFTPDSVEDKANKAISWMIPGTRCQALSQGNWFN